MRLSSVSVIVAILCYVRSQWVYEEDNSCHLPTGEPSQCIPIKNCPKIMFILQHYNSVSMPIPPKVVQVLQKYNCGYDHEGPKVCCPAEKISDVSKHKNIHLINDEMCGYSPSEDRIVGGAHADLSEFPWMTLISYRAPNGRLEFRCGGSLISPKYVLTAAHCLQPGDGSKIEGVRLGEHVISKKEDCAEVYNGKYCAPPVQDVAVAKIIAHAKYNIQSRIDDIGLIKLVSPANINQEHIKTICLPIGEFANKDLSTLNLTVAGWGRNEIRNQADVLLKVKLPVLKNDHCNAVYSKRSYFISDKQLCAGAVLGKDSCSGDSGGPLFKREYYKNDLKFILFGVVSYGPKFCGHSDQIPGVYTRVSHYLDWILDNVTE